MMRNSNRNKTAKNKAILISSILLIVALSSLVLAIPDTLTLQGKLTNSAGTPQSGTFNFSFKIYDEFTSGTILYEKNRNVTPDANGVYDIILQGLGSLNFSSQYYLGITIGTDNESSPRINLTSSPYSFRSNISSNLEQDGTYKISVLNVTGNVSIGGNSDDSLTIITDKINITEGNIKTTGNLTIAEKITFGFGEIIDNIADGFLRVTGNLNVTGNTLVSGTIQAGSFVGGGSLLTGLVVFKNENFTARLNVENASLWNASGNNLILKELTGSVGIGTITPGQKLHVEGSANISTTLNVPVINTTRADQNITINSGGGSIIIRLG